MADYTQLEEVYFKPDDGTQPIMPLQGQDTEDGLLDTEVEIGTHSPYFLSRRSSSVATPTLQADAEEKPRGSGGPVYVSPRHGLFPSAWPASALPPGAEEKFRILGISLAKCLQVCYVTV